MKILQQQPQRFWMDDLGSSNARSNMLEILQQATAAERASPYRRSPFQDGLEFVRKNYRMVDSTKTLVEFVKRGATGAANSDATTADPESDTDVAFCSAATMLLPKPKSNILPIVFEFVADSLDCNEKRVFFGLFESAQGLFNDGQLAVDIGVCLNDQGRPHFVFSLTPQPNDVRQVLYDVYRRTRNMLMTKWTCSVRVGVYEAQQWNLQGITATFSASDSTCQRFFRCGFEFYKTMERLESDLVKDANDSE